MEKNSARIVIVGGGAAGLVLATRLGNFYKRKKQHDVTITLVDATSTHIWKPLLHEISSGTLNSYDEELSYFAHSLRNGYDYVSGTVRSVDTAQRQINVAAVHDGIGDVVREAIAIDYDFLVLAVGSFSNDFNIQGVAEFCFVIDSRAEAEQLHRHISAHLLALKYGHRFSRERPLTVSIVGGGATGVELATELKSVIEHLKKTNYIDGIEDLVKIRLIEAGKTLLPGQTPSNIAFAQRVVEQHGIEILTNSKVQGIAKEHLVLADGLILDSDIHVWATGILAPPFLANIAGATVNAIGQLKVNSYLQCCDNEHVYAVGDCAEYIWNERRLAPTAQAAQQQALYLYRSLIARIEGAQQLDAFRYRDKGSLVSLGERWAIGNLNLGRSRQIGIRGYPAKLAYLSLHRRHQIEVLGWPRALITLLRDFLAGSSRPRIKLH